MTIIYRITSVGRRKANVPSRARTGAELDTILRNYYGMGGSVGDLRITPIVVLGVVGEPVEAVAVTDKPEDAQ